MAIGETADAKKQRLGAKEALALARAASEVVVARGKKIVRVDMKKAPPSDDALLALLLGPTGNLRAPTLRKGKTLLVGFDAATYAEILGKYSLSGGAVDAPTVNGAVD